jgi:hypothetical protein
VHEDGGSCIDMIGVWPVFFALNCCQSLGRLLWLGLGAGRDKGLGLDGVPAA